MKVQHFLSHVLPSQYFRLTEAEGGFRLVIAMGYANSDDILKHIDRDVSLISVSNGTLTIELHPKSS
jgi:hypothetical protein